MDDSANNLTVLVERLRSSGFRVDTRQYLTAHELLLAFARHGRPLDDTAALASHLGPIFCTLPDEQRRFASEVEYLRQELETFVDPCIRWLFDCVDWECVREHFGDLRTLALNDGTVVVLRYDEPPR